MVHQRQPSLTASCVYLQIYDPGKRIRPAQSTMLHEMAVYTIHLSPRKFPAFSNRPIAPTVRPLH